MNPNRSSRLSRACRANSSVWLAGSFAVVFAALTACTGGYVSSPPSDASTGPPSGNPVGGGNPAGGNPGSGSGGGGGGGSFLQTYFADGTDTLNGTGDYLLDAITRSATGDVVFRLTTDYPVQAAIIRPDQVNAFTSGQAFSGIASFNSQIGTNSVTLAAGSYYVGIRSVSAQTNRVRYELDERQRLSGGTLQGVSNSTATVMQPGSKRWDSFTIQAGSRYWIDGCNSGLNAYVIPANQLAAFQSGGSFLQFSEYGGADSPDVYGGKELQLNPGSYYLVQSNPTSRQKSITYVLERWLPAASSTLAAQLASEEAGTPDEPADVAAIPAGGSEVLPDASMFVGSGCGEGGVIPSLSVAVEEEEALVRPHVMLTGGTPSTLALLVAGFEVAAPFGLELGEGCWIYPVPVAVLGTVTTPQGDALQSLPVLDRVVFGGGELYLQWLVPADATVGAGRPAASDARMLRL